MADLTKLNVSQIKTSIDAKLCRASLSYFVKKAFALIDTAEYVHNWHIDLICDYLQQASERKVKRLIINIPPGHMKSLLVNVMWQAWEWLHRPQSTFINASHTASLSIRDSVKMRALLESDWYKSINPSFKLAKDQNAKSLYNNLNGGFRYSMGFGGKATGYRANYIVIDDPISAQSAFSKKSRDKCTEFFDYELSNRLNSMDNDCIVLIMQRLHQDDLTGHLLKQGGWTHLKLPAIFDERLGRSFGDNRQDGELLFTERFGHDVLDKEKLIKGDYGFAGQYQQTPVPSDGGFFKKQDIIFYDDLPCDVAFFDKLVISWDFTFKKSDTSDYVAGQVWGKYKQDYYLLDIVHKRMSFTETKKAVLNLYETWRSTNRNVIVIAEDAANGSAIKDDLRNTLPIVMVKATASKEERAGLVLHLFEAKHVFVRRGYTAFVDELATFPKATNDDQVDACTQALFYISKNTQVVMVGSY